MLEPDAARGSLPSSHTHQAEACGDRTPHPPIRITQDHGDEGFTWTNPVTGETEPRPGSGVVGGSGTAEDPFVIAGWCVPVADAPGQIPDPTGPDGLLVRGTTAHLVIRNNTVSSPTGTGTGVEIERAQNVTVEGNRISKVQAGIRVSNVNGVTVRANSVSAAALGMDLWSVRHGDIGSNLLRNASVSGLQMVKAASSSIHDNRLLDNKHGVSLWSTRSVEIVDNAGEGNAVDLKMDTAHDARVSDNEFGSGIRLSGLSVEHYVHEIDNNTVRGKPLVYVEGEADPDLPDSVGQIIAVNSTDLNISQITVRDAAIGVHVVASRGVNVTDSVLDRNRWGLRIEASRDLVIEDNVVTDSTVTGVFVFDSHGAEIQDNTVEESGPAGIGVWSTRNATILGNVLDRNQVGLDIRVSSDGADVGGNDVTNSVTGIRVRDSQELAVHNNSIAENTDGVRLRRSQADLRHNQITSNSERGVVVQDPARDPFAWVDVRHNNIEGNTVGLEVEDARVDARRNWWGHPTGPSGGADEACSAGVDGRATGLGDPMLSPLGSVCFDPWRVEPVPEAGSD